eukprot:2991236-Rhodomonas_salina.1
MPGADIPVASSYRPTHVLRDVQVLSGYAMSGTDVAYGAIGLRAFYAMPGTDVACGATRHCPTSSSSSVLRSRCSYAPLPAYALAAPCPVPV